MKSLLVQNSKKLQGKVYIDSAKNSVLPIMAASILCLDDVIIENVPNISDVDVMIRILTSMGSKIIYENSMLIINNKDLNPITLDYTATRQIRASCLIMGPLIARFGYAKLPLPGGCKIGARPIDIHLNAFRSLGINVEVFGDEVRCFGKIKPDTLFLEFPSVGATENLLMVCALSNSITTLYNVACEPEICDLGNFINAMGGKVFGMGTKNIMIQGVGCLKACRYTPIPDRIEAGTFLIAAAGTNSDILLENVVPAHLTMVIHKLQQMGCKITETKNTMRIVAPKFLIPTDINSMPYPGFPTDLQPQMMAISTVARGVSTIEEKIFENRFTQCEDFLAMGANIKTIGQVARISGVKELVGCEVLAKDLRGGAAMVIAGLMATGETHIGGIHFINRGYKDIDKKFQGIGGKVYLTKDIVIQNKPLKEIKFSS